MGHKAHTSVANPQEEIDDLVRTLHATQQRLEQLTGGEVDAVVYPSGQYYLLHEAQENLRRSEAALRESEQRYRLLANATHDAIWDWDLVTKAHHWNKGFETLFGYKTDEVEPTIDAWVSRIHEDDRDRVVADFHRSVEAGRETWSGEYRFRRQNGSYAYVLDRGYVMRDTTGKPVRMIGGMTDLTLHKEAQDRIAEQAALLNAASDAIVLKDLGGHILFWNRSAEHLFGWSAAEAEGKEMRKLLTIDAPEYTEAKRSLFEHGHWRGEMIKSTKHAGARTFDVRWTLVRDASGAPRSILAINTDITERKNLEAQVRRAQRMESIGTLAGGIAHDLNNILAPILMAVDLLQREVTSEMGREMLATLHSCSQRGADLVRQVLSFARGVVGERIIVNPVHLMRDIQSIVRETFPKNIEFQFNPPDELWPIMGDPTQLHQVFMNLCVNARDAMPGGGTLTVSMENIEIDALYASMNPDSKLGRHVIVRVSDTGCGIPLENQERIFEPFFTTKEFGEGTGLGLSTSLSIVRGHGGFVGVQSIPGGGTDFRIHFPAAPEEEAAQADSAQAESPRGAGELILVVDDEESIRNIAKMTLEMYGYRVVVAANGAEALVLYAANRETIAAVLTDMSMPVMDGAKTIVALKKLDPTVKIIGTSGLASESGAAEARNAGIEYFIPKPYPAERLLGTLAQILRTPA